MINTHSFIITPFSIVCFHGIPSNHCSFIYWQINLVMAYLTLLLITTILTVTSWATPLYCSDVQSPAASGSHNTDLSQVTTLQYCVINNCTIMRIDTGQQLDIVYTTESLLIITPIDGHTSMVIAKMDDEMPCFASQTSAADDTDHFVWLLVTNMLIMIISSLIFCINLVFKELRHLFGQLLMLYNLGWVILCSAIIVQLFVHYKLAVNSQIICHIIKLTIMTGTLNVEGLALCMFTHITYIIYLTYKLKRISKSKAKCLRKCYIAYVLCMLAIFIFSALIYDITTGSGRFTLQSDGLCSPYMQESYRTQFIMDIFIGVNKVLQVVVLSLYFIYFFKLYKEQISLTPQAFANSQHNRELFKVALAMAESIITSQFFYVINITVGSQMDGIGGIFLIVHQLVIMMCVLCTRQKSRSCRKTLCKKNRIIPKPN